MGICIKDVEMPKEGCRDCPFVKRGQVFDICPFLKREVNGNVERGGKPYDCPLGELPTINAVPVVRCKDCKHWGRNKRLNLPWCYAMHIDKSEDGYCDLAERSEE